MYIVALTSAFPPKSSFNFAFLLRNIKTLRSRRHSQYHEKRKGSELTTTRFTNRLFSINSPLHCELLFIETRHGDLCVTYHSNRNLAITICFSLKYGSLRIRIVRCRGNLNLNRSSSLVIDGQTSST